MLDPRSCLRNSSQLGWQAMLVLQLPSTTLDRLGIESGASPDTGWAATLPFNTSAAANTSNPWQIAAMGLFAWTKWRVISSTFD